MSSATATPGTRPAPLPAAERAAVLARYGVKGYKSLPTSDGVAFTATLLRDGAPFLAVEQQGHGGPNAYHPAGRKPDYEGARANCDTLKADALAWYVGSDDEADLVRSLGQTAEELWPPYEAEDALVGALLDAVERRKWLTEKTRGGKRVMFQADDAIGSDRWREYPNVRPEHIPQAVEAARGRGRRVRVVYRAGAGLKELRDEVFGG